MHIVAGLVEHGAGRVREKFRQVLLILIPDHGILSSGDDEHGLLKTIQTFIRWLGKLIEFPEPAHRFWIRCSDARKRGAPESFPIVPGSHDSNFAIRLGIGRRQGLEERIILQNNRRFRQGPVALNRVDHRG